MRGATEDDVWNKLSPPLHDEGNGIKVSARGDYTHKNTISNIDATFDERAALIYYFAWKYNRTSVTSPIKQALETEPAKPKRGKGGSRRFHKKQRAKRQKAARKQRFMDERVGKKPVKKPKAKTATMNQRFEVLALKRKMGLEKVVV